MNRHRFYRTLKMPCPSLSIVDQAFSIWYHHLIQDTGYYLWRRLPRAASLERKYRDAQKHTPRNIDAQYEGMGLHRGCPGNVGAKRSFRVILFLTTRKYVLLSTSNKPCPRLDGLAFHFTPVLVFHVAHIFTH